MTTSDAIRHYLKDLVEPLIFRRGIAYYALRSVGTLRVEASPDEATVRVNAEVKGSELYHVSFTLDLKKQKLLETSCSCPYEDTCKHVVALGLAYAGSLDTPLQRSSLSDEDHARRVLAELHIPNGAIPQTLINELISSKKYAMDPLIEPTSTPTADVFDPKDYFLLLAAHQGYTPTLYHKDQPSRQAAINILLARTDVTEAQRELFTYLKQGWRHDGRSTPDLARLFPLIVASAIPVYKNPEALLQAQSPLILNLYPESLQAEIRYEPTSSQDQDLPLHHQFLFRMPHSSWQRYGSPGSSRNFTLHGGCLVYETKGVITLYALTPAITGLIRRLQPKESADLNQVGSDTWYETSFTEEETVHLEQIVREAKEHLELLSPPPDLKTQESSICEMAFLVDYRPDSAFLEVIPVIDYGIYQERIATTVYESHRANADLLMRREQYPASTYIIIRKGNTLHYAKIDPQKEIEFYRQVRQEAALLGFSKTLKCIRLGASPLNQYIQLHWPALTEYAEVHSIPFLFSHETLALKRVDFRAEFKTKLEADHDWLYFDLTCYCGEEQITREKLLSYLESGDPFYRREDGTMVTIANRETLEGLTRLLQNFQAQEDGGFAGSVAHAPELEYVMASSPYYEAVRAKSFQTFMEEVQTGKPVKPIKLPKHFESVLRPYQKEGVNWLHFLRSYHFGGILADDMGLGKTIQTLTLLVMHRSPGKPSLVICPKTLVYNWKLEAEKYAPELKVLVIEGEKKERRAAYIHDTEYDLIILSYSTLKQDEDYLLKTDRSFQYVVLDEAQFIKNQSTKSAQVVKRLKADYRLALTGTPFENNVSEIWSIFDFLMPGFLGTHEQFFKRFHKPIMDESDQEALEQLRQKIQPFMLRRTKSEVLKELPAKIEQVSACRLSDAQTILYQEILANVRSEIFETVERRGFKRSQIHILAALTKLRQICNHPALLTKELDWRRYESTKLDTCLELIQEAIDGKHKVLVFSQFTSMLDIVSEALKDQNVVHHYLSGKTRNRQHVIDDFNENPLIPVFLISLKAGGTGLNLTSADTVIIFDPWWNPSVEHQAVDRTHRIGQKRMVNVYRLLTLGTIEEKIQALKQKKQTLFNAMVGESQDLFKKLDWEDIKGLFS